MSNISVQQIEYHRNGVSGEGFHVILFKNKEKGEETKDMVGIVFPYEKGKENPRVAVFDRKKLGKGEIRFLHNSWRGDHFAPELIAAIKGWEFANRVG